MQLDYRVRVDAVRQVFNDGNHNAFTDLCQFQGKLYLTFRSCPDGHMVFPTSKIVILRSDDAQQWQKVFEFSVADRDVRDPHFLVFDNRLFVYSGTWSCAFADMQERDLNDHLGYGVWSEDGESWHGPQHLEGTYGHYIWRAATYGGKAYLCGRRKREFVCRGRAEEDASVIQSALLVSDDGLVFKTAGLFAETDGDETAFLFEEDGSILAVVRGPRRGPAQIARSRPPYREWDRVKLDRFVGGPLLTRWGDRYLVGGRRMVDGANPRTVLYWLVGDKLQEIAELPSGGDNSYPGFVELGATRGLLSYYSSHEGSGSHLPPSAIYLAELSLT